MGLSACFSLIFCKIQLAASRFLVGTLHSLANPWLCKWYPVIVTELFMVFLSLFMQLLG